MIENVKYPKEDVRVRERLVHALDDCLDNSQHLKTNAKLGSKFSKDSIIAQMGTYKSQEKEKQSKENWTTEGCGRRFLLKNININIRVIKMSLRRFSRWINDYRG